MSERHVLQLECGSGFEYCRGRGCQNVKHMERENGMFDEGRSNSMFSCSSGFTIDTIDHRARELVVATGNIEPEVQATVGASY